MKKIIAVALAVVVTFSSSVFAVENNNGTPEQLQKIIITPNRFSQRFQNSTGEITIISRQDIENSGAEILLDVFQTIKGIVVKDYYGNGARASIDIRGFGEASSSNALVLVDGRRVNTPDLSGVDWMQIPLDRVERIEILHGGTGAVLYGDNAVGGVVNIITKSGRTRESTFTMSSSGGSYGMNKQSFSSDGATERISYSVTASRLDTNGYRQNSEYRSKDVGTKLKIQMNDALAVKMSGGYHEADLGLPGPLNKEQFATLSRKESVAAQRDNNVGERDYYMTFGLEGVTFDFGVLNIDASFRRKTSDSYWPNFFTPTISQSRLDTIAITPNYTCTLDLFGRPNKIIAGFDFYKTDSKVNDFNSSTDVQTSDNDLDQYSMGYYLSDSFDITENLSLDMGYRFEKIVHGLNYVDKATPTNDRNAELKRKEDAFKGGLVYILNKDTQVFFNASKSFRSPLTDEFLFFDSFFVRQINAGLSTQTSLGFDSGLRHAFNKYLAMDLTLFHMDIKNEIFFNPVTFTNSNYDKTRHQGVNLQVDLKVTKRITAFINWMYTRARFRKGSFDRKTIPMVPLNKASAGFNLGFWKNFKVIPVINFVGRRYLISDQANQAGKLNAYITADLRMSFEKENYEIFFNANNIFDRHYVDIAVTNAAGTAKNYYPSPGRNFSGGVKLKF